MKKLLLVPAIALSLSGCATSKQIGGTTCHPYGYLNQETRECSEAIYEVAPGNMGVAIVGAFLAPIGWVATAYIVGFDLYRPVKEKPKNEH